MLRLLNNQFLLPVFKWKFCLFTQIWPGEKKNPGKRPTEYCFIFSVETACQFRPGQKVLSFIWGSKQLNNCGSVIDDQKILKQNFTYFSRENSTYSFTFRTYFYWKKSAKSFNLNKSHALENEADRWYAIDWQVVAQPFVLLSIFSILENTAIEKSTKNI
jgi:hypothetical protein